MLAPLVVSLIFVCGVIESRSTITKPTEEFNQVGDWRIVNGEEAKRHEFPWMAMVSDSILGIQSCGATLISDRYVLTAGHCMRGVPTENPPILRIVLGAHDKTLSDDPDVEVLAVRRVINHPDYKPIFTHDFTLLELEKSVKLGGDKIKPICLPPTDKNFTGEAATVAGWGRISHGGPSSAILRKAEVFVVNQQECKKKFEGAAEVLDDMICAGGNGKDACQRDSGGPLMWQDNNNVWHLIGVVSWGDDCGSLYFPGVYSRVSSVVPWIKSVVGDGLC